jgi:hypothetical protein
VDAAWSIQSLCTAVALLLSDPAPESPLSTPAGNLLRVGDVVGYKSMAKMYAEKFARTTNEFFRAPRRQRHRPNAPKCPDYRYLQQAATSQ